MEWRDQSDIELIFLDRIKSKENENLLMMRKRVVVSPIEALGIVVLSNCRRPQPMRREW